MLADLLSVRLFRFESAAACCVHVQGLWTSLTVQYRWQPLSPLGVARGDIEVALRWPMNEVKCSACASSFPIPDVFV